MQTTKKVSLEKLFPQDESYWKVVWVDGLVNKLDEKEPELRVFISRLKSSINSSNNPLDLSNLSKGENEIINVGVGHLNLIYIGSVWHKGIDVSSQFDYEKFKFEIDTRSAKNITISEKGDNGKRIIPPQQYPVGKAFEYIKNTNLIALENQGIADGLLVPASEIIRFYYLITTSMALSVYYGRFDDLFLENPKINTTNRNVEFTLNWGVSERNIAVIARYLSSQLTKDRIDEVHHFVQTNHLNKKEVATSYSFFPFDGITTLTCEGHTIYSDDKVKRFLCTRLISCTGDMGFDSVVATKLVSTSLKKELDDESMKLPYMWPLYSDVSDDQIVLDEEPSKKHLSKTFISPEVRFPNLIGKKIEINRKQRDGDKSWNIVSENLEGTRNISTSTGTYSETNTRKANLEYDVSDDDFIIPPRLQSFIDCLSHLKEEGWKVNSIKVDVPDQYKKKHEMIESKKIGDIYLLGLFNNGIDVKNKSWAETKIGENIYHRGIVIAEAMLSGSYWYLFELEPNKSDSEDSKKGFSILVRYVKDKSALSNNELYQFMCSCVRNAGWPKLEEVNERFSDSRLNHTTGLKETLLLKMKN